MKRLIVFLLMSMAIISLASASQPSLPDPVQAGECVSLPQTCTSCTYNNITTIVRPDGIEDIYASMTKNGDNYNYTYCNTGDVGTYVVNGFGDLDGEDTNWDFTFYTTYDGKPNDPVTLSTRFFIWLIVLVLLAVAGFVSNQRLEEGESERYAIMSWLAIIITGISGLIIIEDFLTLIIGGLMALLGVVQLFNIFTGHFDSPRSWA